MLISDEEKRMQFDLCLAEYEFVWAQMHQRMSGISNLTSLSAGFFAFVVGFVVTEVKLPSDDYYFLAISSFIIPFFLLGALIAREDFFMLSHDSYIIQELRPKILFLSGLSNAEEGDEYFVFLYSMDDLKTGFWFQFLGIARYLFSILGLLFIAGVIIWERPAPLSAAFLFGLTVTTCLLYTSPSPRD